MQKLHLLGRWDETPLETWPGFCRVATDGFCLLTDCFVEPFSFNRNGLHEQYYVFDSVQPLFDWFDSAGEAEWSTVTDRVCEFYSDAASALDDFTEEAAGAKIVDAPDQYLQSLVTQWQHTPGRLAAPIFVAVALDGRYMDADVAAPYLSKLATIRNDCALRYDLRAKPQFMRVVDEIAYRTGADASSLQYLFPDELNLAIKPSGLFEIVAHPR